MNIFEGSSKAHKNQVRSSYTGDEIDGFVLGREEGVHLSSDGYRDFLLDDNEDKLIRLYANNPLEAEFRMGPELPDWTQAFLPEIFHLNGHVIVMERITTSIVDIPWTSEEMNLLEIDNRHMIAMASLARACAENGMMPKKMLTKGSLTFSEECIKFRDIKLKPFNLIEMETLLWSFSQNNRYVFANLMAASHIKDVDSQAMIVPLYREALDLAVDNLEFDPEQIIAIRFGENNPKLSTELNVFYSRVRVLKSRIIKTIKESYLCDTDEAKALLADFIGDSMKIFYQESCAITVLMEDIFCRDIVNGFLSLNELEMKPKDVIRILQRIIKELTNTGIETLDSLDVLLTDSLFQKHGVVNSEQIRHVFRFRIYKCFEYIFKGELL